jgi:uncharacterized protein
MSPLLIVLIAAGFVAVAVALIGVIGWFGSEKALKPPRWDEEHNFEAFGLEPEDITFTTRDGLRIAGHYLAGSNGATLLLSHGYGRSHEEMIPHAAYLNRRGYACLLFDQRSRGRSEGKLVSAGALERLDVIAALDYVVGRPEADPSRIGAFAVSGGAAATLLAAAEDERIRAVAVEACFRNIRSVVASSFKHFTGLPAFPFADATVKVAELRLGYSADVLAPERAVARISPRPILFMHGEEDHAIHPSASQHMFALAGEPKELWLIPATGHAKGLEVAGPEYERRVDEFFHRYLLEESQPVPTETVAESA